MIHPHDIYSPQEPWTIRIVSLAREFRDKGHQVKLAYCPLNINERKRNVDLQGIEIIHLSRSAGLKSLFSNIQALKKCSEWADIIHVQKCFHYVAIPALVLACILDKPLHYDWDDWEEKIWYHSNKMSLHSLIFGTFLKLLERWLPAVADTVSVSSDKLKELCLSFGIEEGRIFKAPVGADLKKFSPRISGDWVRKKHELGNKEVILYLGQLHGGQYVSMFIEAANIILCDYPNTAFLIVGQGYMLERLNKLVIDLGIEEHVIFTGSVDHDKIPNYIAAADICVACFEHNDITICKSPLKVVEYLASGKPIVASLVGEVRNMVGGAGFLVEPGNCPALAKAITELLENTQLRLEMGLRAWQRAETRYNWSRTAENISTAYYKSVRREQ
jgi:glycosyltransferase involved in cell wall biosynthesis